jgi:LysM repeat protein
VTFVAVCAALSLISPHPTAADRSYRVRRGDTPARIAQRHRVSVNNLLAANRMERGDQLREGQEIRIPDRGVHYVQSGESLSEIASDYEVSIQALARANRLRPNASLRIGQRLVLPGHEADEERERAEARWGRPRRPGVAQFIRVRPEVEMRLRLVDRSGRARRAATRRLAPVMRERGSRRTREPHRRLVRVLAQISDHFGGRPIYVISGFRRPRGYTRETSRHTSGRAMDLRVRGVPITALRDYARTLDRVGVGFYPESRFVHVDVREERAYWIDTSSPGEAPEYRRRNRGSDSETDSETESETDSEPDSDAETETASSPGSASASDPA